MTRYDQYLCPAASGILAYDNTILICRIPVNRFGDLEPSPGVEVIVLPLDGDLTALPDSPGIKVLLKASDRLPALCSHTVRIQVIGISSDGQEPLSDQFF